jgi:uncharacterized protein YbaR (Trm112 family)
MSESAVPIDPALLAVLACPQCHGSLTPVPAALDCAACALRYPVQDGIPVLLLDEARPIGEGA